MKLSQVKALLPTLNQVVFKLENGTQIPDHFHVTEVGAVTKHFIDCGGTVRKEQTVNFQLWSATDFDHRLEPTKLLSIIELSEKSLCIEDDEIEVEYQSDTIGKYALAFDGKSFILQNKTTACLATDKCGIPQVKPKIKLANLQASKASACQPNSGCCS